VSGNTISFGSGVVFNEAATSDLSMAPLSSSEAVIVYADSGCGTAVVGTVSGDTISFGPEGVFRSARTFRLSVAAPAGSEAVVAYADSDGFRDGLATILYPDAEFGDHGAVVGIADDSASAGGTVPVVVHGVSDNHSGLSAGHRYYALPTGELATSTSSVCVGAAISATELLVGSTH